MELSRAEELIRLAREAIVSEIKDQKSEYRHLGEKRGVFVTLLKNNKLRGCIGFPKPIFPLEKAVFEAARAAGFRDPRFPPVSEKELDKICIELSVLTKPEKIKTIDQIIVGESGLIVSNKGCSGLLLPQVAVEHEWDRQEFLEHTCLKAGLQKSDWEEADIFVFECEVFREESPNGRVERKL